MTRAPARTLEEVAAFDAAEIMEGYRDGRANEPCGDNRSPSYWHGWRNGRVDGGHAPKDEAQAALAREYVAMTRERKVLQ
jgi:hypothetical protein